MDELRLAFPVLDMVDLQRRPKTTVMGRTGRGLLFNSVLLFPRGPLWPTVQPAPQSRSSSAFRRATLSERPPGHGLVPRCAGGSGRRGRGSALRTALDRPRALRERSPWSERLVSPQQGAARRVPALVKLSATRPCGRSPGEQRPAHRRWQLLGLLCPFGLSCYLDPRFDFLCLLVGSRWPRVRPLRGVAALDCSVRRLRV